MSAVGLKARRQTVGDPVSSQKMGSYSEPISDSEKCSKSVLLGCFGLILCLPISQVVVAEWRLPESICVLHAGFLAFRRHTRSDNQKI